MDDRLSINNLKIMERDTRDPLRAVIALHPTKSECIAVALGDQIRVYVSIVAFILSCISHLN